MLYDIQNIYQSACLVAEFEEDGRTIQLWGDRTHIWLDPVVEQWQGVALLLNRVIQETLVNVSPEDAAPHYGEGDEVACVLSQTDRILQTLISNPEAIEGVVLMAVNNVPIAERQRWVKRLEWNEDPERGDGPLHFFHCAESGPSKKLGVVIPIEAVDEWLIAWNHAYFYWSGDLRRSAPRLVAGAKVLFQLPPTAPAKSLAHCEQWARQIDRLAPKLEETHRQWNQLHLALEPHGLFAPEDGGLLGHQLVQQGYDTLAQYREAAIALYAHAEVIPGLFLPQCDHPLAATVSLHWFRLGPFHDDKQDVLRYLNYGIPSFLDSKSLNTSSCLVSSSSGGGGGTFWYAKGMTHSQLYAGRQAVQAHGADGFRLSEVSARLSRAGHTQVARAIASFAILQDPEQFQHWVELGMTFWYDGRGAEGMACLERAAEMNRGFALSPFLKQKRAEAMVQTIPPPKSAEQYLEEALPEALPLWSSLPKVFQLTLVWLRSVVAEPRFEAHWIGLLDTVGDGYLRREIFRGLAPKSQQSYLAQQPLEQGERLQAHRWSMG